MTASTQLSYHYTKWCPPFPYNPDTIPLQLQPLTFICSNTIRAFAQARLRALAELRSIWENGTEAALSNEGFLSNEGILSNGSTLSSECILCAKPIRLCWNTCIPNTKACYGTVILLLRVCFFFLFLSFFFFIFFNFREL